MELVSEFLQKLGFSRDSTALFVTLTQNGPLTLLEASRKANLERTRLYRLVGELKQRGLIEEIPAYKRRTIKAASLSTIEMMVREQEMKVKSLSGSFPALAQALQTLTQSASESNVIYYHGREGIKQMTWHILRCQGLYRTYSYRFWEEMTGLPFVLKLNEKMVEQKFKVHDLYSEQYLVYKKQWLKSHGSKPEGDWSFWKSRFISEKILLINQNIDVYNDVVAYYHWQGEETFGVEIYNERVAEFHKQMHDIVWKMAKPISHFDWRKKWHI
jgi:DNA-binding Lrp family transcriptional regulator